MLRPFARMFVVGTLAAAATLGIDTTTLWRKRKRYGIE